MMSRTVAMPSTGNLHFYGYLLKALILAASEGSFCR